MIPANRGPMLVLGLACVLALAACSFRGGDFAPLAKEPDTPCSIQAEEFCKESLSSENHAVCVKREKYRCELLEQESPPPTP
jgi:hypothetical protein